MAERGGDWRGPVRLIAQNPTLAAQLVEALPQIERRMAPATDVEIMKVLVEEGVHFGIKNLTPGEYAALFGSYLDALAKVPVECLKDAFLLWNQAKLYPDEPKRHGYMPRAAEIYVLAERSWGPMRTAAYRAKRASEFHEALPKPPPSAEDRERVQAMLAEFRGVRSVPQPHLRPSGHNHEVAERLRRAAEERSR